MDDNKKQEPPMLGPLQERTSGPKKGFGWVCITFKKDRPPVTGQPNATDHPHRFVVYPEPRIAPKGAVIFDAAEVATLEDAAHRRVA